MKTHYKDNKQAYKARAKRDYAKETEKARALLEELRGNRGCAHCGEDHPAVLEFHHSNPNEKEEGVAALAWKNRRKAREEAKKSALFCAQTATRNSTGI